MLNNFPYASKKGIEMAVGIKGYQILSDVEMVGKGQLFTYVDCITIIRAIWFIRCEVNKKQKDAIFHSMQLILEFIVYCWLSYVFISFEKQLHKFGESKTQQELFCSFLHTCFWLWSETVYWALTFEMVHYSHF